MAKKTRVVATEKPDLLGVGATDVPRFSDYCGRFKPEPEKPRGPVSTVICSIKNGMKKTARALLPRRKRKKRRTRTAMEVEEEPPIGI